MPRTKQLSLSNVLLMICLIAAFLAVYLQRKTADREISLLRKEVVEAKLATLKERTKTLRWEHRERRARIYSEATKSTVDKLTQDMVLAKRWTIDRKFREAIAKEVNRLEESVPRGYSDDVDDIVWEALRVNGNRPLPNGFLEHINVHHYWCQFAGPDEPRKKTLPWALWPTPGMHVPYLTDW